MIRHLFCSHELITVETLFMMAALWSLTNNTNIWFISLLASVEIIACHIVIFPASWHDECFTIIILKLWMFLRLFILLNLWIVENSLWGVGKGQGSADVCLHWDPHLDWEMWKSDSLCILAGRGGKSSPSTQPCWHLLREVNTNLHLLIPSGARENLPLTPCLLSSAR